MMLKLFDYSTEEFMYIDNIKDIKVSTRGLYVLKRFDKSDPEIKKIRNDKNTQISLFNYSDYDYYYALYNRSYKCLVIDTGYFMFFIKELISHYPEKEEIELIFININHNEPYPWTRFIVSDEPMYNIKGFIMNDSGKTVERL